MDSTSSGRNLILAIDEFKRAHNDDDSFGGLVEKLDGVRDEVTQLVPSAKEKPGESPGKRDAREIGESRSRESSGRSGDDD